MKSCIAVVGSYNEGLVVQSDRIPVWGETLMGSEFSNGPGGKGSNQAVAASRLGARSLFVGCVGDDQFGLDAINMLRDEEVDTTYVFKSKTMQTGVGVIVVSSTGENCIIVAPGANNALKPKDVDLAVSFIDQADILLCQLEIDPHTTEHAMKLAYEKGKIVILNPAPAMSNSSHLLKYASILTPNETELNVLCGKEPARKPNEQECIEMSRSLLEKGPKTVIITRGEEGALIVEKDKVLKSHSPKVNAVDTTGAGDSFSAALAVALGEGKDIETSVEFACYTGAYTVTGKEVIPSLPTRQELENFMKQNS